MSERPRRPKSPERSAVLRAMPSRPQERVTRRGPGRVKGTDGPIRSRNDILKAALDVVEREGPDAVTMRRLAAEMDVSPMALYRHFATKAALIESLIDAVLGELDLDALDASGWRPWMESFAHASRRLLLAHPGFVRVLAEHPAVGPNALVIGERAYEVLRNDGLPPDATVQGFWTVFTYVVGFVALETPRAARSTTDAAEQQRQRVHAFAALDKRRFPRTVELAVHVAAMVSDEQFVRGLSAILDGLALRSAAKTGRTSPRTHRT